jgi:hypothetical protein
MQAVYTVPGRFFGTARAVVCGVSSRYVAGKPFAAILGGDFKIRSANWLISYPVAIHMLVLVGARVTG